MRAPVGEEEIRAVYGDPRPLIGEDGSVSPIWESNMVLVPMPGPLPLGWATSVLAKRVRVHKAIAQVVQETFEALSAAAWSHLRTYDGGYAWRVQRGSTSKLSMHSFGAALDFDAKTNGLGRKGDMHRDVIRTFREHGWTWGGEWKRPDPMHFQFGSGY
jgi:hypothetical protein